MRHAPLGEDTIRAVPPRRQSHAKRNALLAVMLLLVVLAALQWYMVHAG